MPDGGHGNRERNVFLWQVLWTPVTDLDKKVLAVRNQGRRFDLSLVYAVAFRCINNFPQVVVCRPLAGDEPFPTTFWLTCPYLDKKCAELESRQQISRLEEVLASREEKVAEWHKDYVSWRKLMIDSETTRRLTEKNPSLLRSLLEKGAGGIDYRNSPGAAKCLHLQTAAWLAMRAHPAEDWLADKLGCLECRDGDCLSFTQ